MTKILDGKAVSAAVKESIKAEVGALKEKGVEVSLAVVLVGNDPASKIYVANKKKACEATGIRSLEYILDGSTGEEELVTLIKKLNADKSVNGILCQLPLPKGLDEKKIINTELICNLYKIKKEDIINIVEFNPANAIKITIKRPIPSGNLGERDVYGAQQHAPLLLIEF